MRFLRSPPRCLRFDSPACSPAAGASAAIRSSPPGPRRWPRMPSRRRPWPGERPRGGATPPSASTTSSAGSSPRRCSASARSSSCGRRWAAPLGLLYTGLAVGVAIAVPLTAPVTGDSIPEAQDHLDFVPARLLAVLGNSIGTVLVIGIALLDDPPPAGRERPDRRRSRGRRRGERARGPRRRGDGRLRGAGGRAALRGLRLDEGPGAPVDKPRTSRRDCPGATRGGGDVRGGAAATGLTCRCGWAGIGRATARPPGGGLRGLETRKSRILEVRHETTSDVPRPRPGGHAAAGRDRKREARQGGRPAADGPPLLEPQRRGQLGSRLLGEVRLRRLLHG